MKNRLIYLANVPSHLSRLLLASEPAPQAKCQKCRRHGIRWTGSLAFLFILQSGDMFFDLLGNLNNRFLLDSVFRWPQEIIPRK